MTPLCPCGNPITSTRNNKYCSRSCAGTHGGGHRPASEHCRACGWLMDVDNTYVGKAGPRKDRRRCRRCLLAKGDPNYVPGPKGSPRPKPAPAPRVEPERPAWRPPGWAPVPSVRRVAG